MGVELKRLAFRNLSRHRAKTVLTALAIMVSVTLYIFMDGWISGMTMESRRNIVNYETGAAKLQTRLYFDKQDELPSFETFGGWESYAAALDKAGYYAAPRYVFSATLYSLTGSAPMLFNAVDPGAEAEVLYYSPYLESGRAIRPGGFEIVLGALAAEKLQVGIPQRIYRQKLEGEIAALAANQRDRDFILSLYEAQETGAGGFLSLAGEAEAGNERMILKRGVPAADLERFWKILDDAGRNLVRIAATIDLKVLPETIREDKWGYDLWPALTETGRALAAAAYQQDAEGNYQLLETDAARRSDLLNAMIRADFNGAVVHVNQIMDALVVGVLNSPDPATNGNIAYMPLDALQGESGMMLQGAVTELLIREKGAGPAALPGEKERAAAITAALETGLGRSLPVDLGVFTWRDYVADYLGFEALESGATRILSIMLFFLSLLGISNTVLMSVLERTKEIGMMRALGMTGGQMILTYMLEAGFIGLIGSILGIAAGCLINWPMVEYGVDFSALLDAVGGSIGYRVAGNMRAMWNIPVIIGSALVATLIASVTAVFPTRRAVKRPITDSLRFE
jgi:ABC-type lipoprotein release transport system permease subunit